MTLEPEAPPYGTGTLAEVLPSAAAALRVPGFHDVLDLSGPAEGLAAVTVLLVDGLGWWPWQERLALTPSLADMASRRLSTTVPSTTPTALGSLGTGTPPGAHGIVGASFRLAEDDQMLHPLSWKGDPHPVATQPEPTVFERAAAAGVPVLSVGASAYAESGLTRAVLRGAAYAGVDSADAMVDAVAHHHRGLAYAYVPELDRLGHVHGVDSHEWGAGLAEVDRLVGRLLERLGPDHLLVITADHGMVDCPPSSRVRVEALPGFDAVEAVGGEPRLRHIYCSAGREPEIIASWRDALGERAIVLSRDEAVHRGLFGAVDPDYADRIGDIVVLALGDTVLVSEADPLVSGLLGQHGSVTDAEMAIPLLVARGTGRG